MRQPLKIAHIVVISSNYPSMSRPFYGTFVRQLVIAIAKIGVKCSVISPVSIFHRRYGHFDPERSLDFSIKENPITIFRPRFISFSSKNFYFFNTEYLTQKSFLMAVNRSLSCVDPPPSLLYGHFLYPGGATAINLASKLGIPSCVAVGEGSFWSVEPTGFQKAIKDFSHVTSVISVSSTIKQSLARKLRIPKKKILMSPNGVDRSLFYPRDLNETRHKFGFPIGKFIIAFTGHFEEGKGPNRLLSAITGMNNVGLILVGSGSIPLNGDNILFKGVLRHSEVAEMLSAADIFVLPSLVEGSCNAIIEALACGLPVITSNGEFNDDIVDDNVAIRIDPSSIDELRDAITILRNNHELRKRMSVRALEKSKQFDINQRALKILDWIKECEGKFFS